jgi:hypothetical protein
MESFTSRAEARKPSIKSHKVKIKPTDNHEVEGEKLCKPELPFDENMLLLRDELSNC